MRLSLFTMSVVALATPFAANAQDRTAYQHIATGDFQRAERTLIAERRIFPQRPELMLNLAAVYQQTGRAEQARALYDMVLGRPEVMMDVSADRVAGSHAIARNGLRRLPGVQMSSR
ncbi:tetratricopeptide repeat protein [Sphingomonas sp. PB4P5]|uniref:tetratricopeptide repeat protein n=1 Tax=Parasphingomonas puruogangriensis TaxID=3096155 RepID=UPI002FCB6EAC